MPPFRFQGKQVRDTSWRYIHWFSWWYMLCYCPRRVEEIWAHRKYRGKTHTGLYLVLYAMFVFVHVHFLSPMNFNFLTKLYRLNRSIELLNWNHCNTQSVLVLFSTSDRTVHMFNISYREKSLLLVLPRINSC